MRTFEDKPATREQVPLLIGLMGPSGGGKTYSALRLATGIQQVVGGDIHVIDTEARRSLHYADQFNFRHVQFEAPFSPLDYLAAVQHCVKQGASVVVIDSMSHEHEGPGGVLEMHEQEVERLSGGDWKKAERVKMLAWSKPKAARRRLINSLLQLKVNTIFCFRAKEKLRMPDKSKGEREPQKRGWMPIAGEEFLYEMTTCALLTPNAKGVPKWQTEYDDGEGLMIKLPGQFADILTPNGKPVQLTESIGEAMARWGAGSSSPSALQSILFQLDSAETLDAVNVIADSARNEQLSRDEKLQLSAAFKTRREQLQ